MGDHSGRRVIMDRVIILIEIQGSQICLFVGHQLIRTWRLKHTSPDGAPLELARHIRTALEVVHIDAEIENLAGELEF
jgi:hypothetical protein